MPRRPEFPAGAPAPSGAYAPVVRAGGFLYVSGQGAVDHDGRVRAATLREQVQRTMENVRFQLEGCEATLADVVSVTVYLADMGKFDEFDRAYAAFFPEDDRPARTTVGADLGDIQIEIQVVAYVGCAS